MIRIALLEDSDTIRADDWVRQLGLLRAGQSDFLITHSPYGGSPLNRLGWIPASEFCPAWVGKRVGDFNKALNGETYSRHAVETCQYEFVRGSIPKKHREPKDW